MASVISIRNLVKTYTLGGSEVRALAGVSFDVEAANSSPSPDRPGRASPR